MLTSYLLDFGSSIPSSHTIKRRGKVHHIIESQDPDIVVEVRSQLPDLAKFCKEYMVNLCILQDLKRFFSIFVLNEIYLIIQERTISEWTPH